MSTPSRWSQLRRGSAQQYAARFAELAAAGNDMHGEASFVAALCPAPAHILDAGCGTGRVAIRLAQLGYDCCGVDSDAAMLAEAVTAEPSRVSWALGDISNRSTWSRRGDSAVAGGSPSRRADAAVAGRSLPEWLTGDADLVVMAGNVIPLLAPGSLQSCLTVAAAVLRPDGLLVAGFGLDPTHLPRGCPPTALSDLDAAAAVAGFTVQDRYSSWDTDAFVAGSGYAVSVLIQRR